MPDKKELNHLAIIMDGNGRWAEAKKLPVSFGHKMGAECLKERLKDFVELGIRYVTIYAFSTENWQRSQDEIDDLKNILNFYLSSEEENLIKSGIKVHIIGDISNFGSKVVSKIENLVDKTKNNDKLMLNIAIGYGGREEILHSVKKICKNIIVNNKDCDKITEQDFEDCMYSDFPDPDLLIRTGNRMRVSNFLLWQIAYSELYFTDVMWPDFSKNELLKAISDFKNRSRTYGKR